jgi:hypothetical protein
MRKNAGSYLIVVDINTNGENIMMIIPIYHQGVTETRVTSGETQMI